MPWKFPVLIAVATSVLLPTTALAEPVHAKHHLRHPWHGYGFLPGYRSPERIERERARDRGPVYPVYGYGGPGFFWFDEPGYYHGRWNGGSYGPCWTLTPIGAHYNCD